MQVQASPDPPKLWRFVVAPMLALAGASIGAVFWSVGIPYLMERPGPEETPTRFWIGYDSVPAWLVLAISALVYGCVISLWAFREAKKYYAQSLLHYNDVTAAIAEAVEARLLAQDEIKKIRDAFEATQEVKTFRALSRSDLVRLGDQSVTPILFLKTLASDIGLGFPPEHLINNLGFHLHLTNARARISFHENVGICVSHGVLLPITQNLSDTIKIPLVQRYEVTDLGSRVLAVRPGGD